MAEPIEVVATYQDQANKKSTNTSYIADGLTIAQIEEGLQGFAQLIDDVTNALINGIDFSISIDGSGLTGNVAGGTSDVEEVAEFISRTAAGREVRMNIPATNDTASVAGSDDLDQTDTDVAAIVSLLEDGLSVTGGTIIPSDVDENDIIEVVTARERVRNSGSAG